ncbi:dethiobiotin synthase [Ostertagia ostertagi]
MTEYKAVIKKDIGYGFCCRTGNQEPADDKQGHLVMEIGQRSFAYAAVDTEGNLQHLRVYEMDARNTGEWCDEWRALLKADDWLKYGPEKKTIVYNLPESQMVPEQYYSAAAGKDMVALFHGDINSGITLCERIEGQPRIWSQQDEKKQAQHTDYITAVFYPNRILAGVVKGNQLQLVQSFVYEAAEDVGPPYALETIDKLPQLIAEKKLLKPGVLHQPIFITGIGTGIGKTLVAAVVAQALQAAYWKPVQAGVEDGTDSQLVETLLSGPSPGVYPELYKLQLAASPHIAARKEAVTIRLADIKGRLEEINSSAQQQPLVIEGAGGLMVPLNDREFVADLIKQLQARTVALLKTQGIAMADAVIIATNGWTTGDLMAAVRDKPVSTDYDVVSLLIGVNNQYRGGSIEEYRQQFTVLLQRSIQLANGKPNHVVVLSIPDYSVTPFASGSNKQQIAREIDAFNEANKMIAADYKVHYLYITDESRKAAADPSLVKLPGFTGYALPAETGTEEEESLLFSEKDGLHNWTNARQKLQYFFNVGSSGSLMLSLWAKNARVGTVLQVRIAGKKFAVNVPASSVFRKLKLGTVAGIHPGFYTIEITALKKAGSTIAAIQSVELEGSAAAGIQFNAKPRRNAASVHLKYPVADSAKVVSFYSELMVPAGADPLYTYYMADGFARGYFGMQGVNGQLSRKAFFGNQWIRQENGQWTALTKASFSYDATGRAKDRIDYGAGTDGDKFYLWNGGFQPANIKFGDTLLRNGAASTPVIDFYRNADSAVQAATDKRLIAERIANGKLDTTGSVGGVFYKMLKEGTGRNIKVTDTVIAYYKGSLLNGTVFDQTIEKPASFPLGRLIKGWQIGLPVCRIGGKIQLIIPSNLGYGIRSRSSKIPVNSVLVFEIEVVDAKRSIVLGGFFRAGGILVVEIIPTPANKAKCYSNGQQHHEFAAVHIAAAAARRFTVVG